MQQLILLLPNLLIAALILVATFFAARLVRQFIARFLPRLSHSAALNNLIETAAYLGILAGGVFYA